MDKLEEWVASVQDKVKLVWLQKKNKSIGVVRRHKSVDVVRRHKSVKQAKFGWETPTGMIQMGTLSMDICKKQQSPESEGYSDHRR